MKNETLFERSGRIASWMDVIAFIGAFVAGVIFYIITHLVFHSPPVFIIIGIICVMIAYAFLVARIPRLRVRMDQAGDNAYYLGLLFTLMSMAFALYEFGTVVSDEYGNQNGPSGVQQIIANFGIALASTIIGIFLRVTLNQMRIDPADVESMTRIELAEASKEVKTKLNNVTLGLSLFFDEIKQRSNDLVTTLFDNVKNAEIKLSSLLDSTSKEMQEATTKTQREVLAQTKELANLIEKTSIEVKEAIERLQVLEPPTRTLSTRLNKITNVLEVTGNQAERLTAQFQESAISAKASADEISKTSGVLAQLTERMTGTHANVALTIQMSAEKVKTVLQDVSQGLALNKLSFEQLTAQTKLSVEESERAQKAALDVLNCLTDVTRGLTNVLKDADIRGEHANKR